MLKPPRNCTFLISIFINIYLVFSIVLILWFKKYVKRDLLIIGKSKFKDGR